MWKLIFRNMQTLTCYSISCSLCIFHLSLPLIYGRSLSIRCDWFFSDAKRGLRQAETCGTERDGDEDFQGEIIPAPLLLPSRERKSEQLNHSWALYDCFKCPCLGTSEQIRWYPIPGTFCEESLTRDPVDESLETWDAPLCGQLQLTRTWASVFQVRSFQDTGLPPSSSVFPKHSGKAIPWLGFVITLGRISHERPAPDPGRRHGIFGGVRDTGSHLSAEPPASSVHMERSPAASMSEY